MSHPNFNHLHYFHVVATQGSLSAAARDLGLATSTLSEQVKQLEDWFGHALFERGPTGMLLNEYGRRALRYTTSMFEQSKLLMEELQGQPSEGPQVLSIGVSSAMSLSFASDAFVPLFQVPVDLTRNLGERRICPRIVSGDHNQMIRRLVRRDLHILISDSLPLDTEKLGLATEVLHRPELIAVGDATLSKKVKEFPRDVGAVPVIAHSAESRTGFEVSNFFRAKGISLDTVGETTDLGLMLTLAERGLALAFLPRSVAEERLRTRKLRNLGQVDRMHAEVVAIYSKTELPRLVEWAVHALKQESSIS